MKSYEQKQDQQNREQEKKGLRSHHSCGFKTSQLL